MPKPLETFTVAVEDPDIREGVRYQLGEQRSRSYCRRLARQMIFEGAARADVIRASDGEIVLSYTPDNAPVASARADGRCPLRYGNDKLERFKAGRDRHYSAVKSKKQFKTN